MTIVICLNFHFSFPGVKIMHKFNWIKRSKIKINNSILFQFKFWKIMWLWLHCADLK